MANPNVKMLQISNHPNAKQFIKLDSIHSYTYYKEVPVYYEDRNLREFYPEFFEGETEYRVTFAQKLEIEIAIDDPHSPGYLQKHEIYGENALALYNALTALLPPFAIELQSLDERDEELLAKSTFIEEDE